MAGAAFAGVDIGGDRVDETQTFRSATGFALDPAGMNYAADRAGQRGGLDLGCNYQIGQFALGAEGDFELTDIQGVGDAKLRRRQLP